MRKLKKKFLNAEILLKTKVKCVQDSMSSAVHVHLQELKLGEAQFALQKNSNTLSGFLTYL